ncbi:tetratricopeptide repeat protein, partial [Runella defluvii]
MKNKPYHIFLASSFRLEVERQAFRNEINRINDFFAKEGTYLQLDIWEKFDAANDPVRKQNFYNEHIKNADIFAILYWGELGAFTTEEYLLAQQLFQEKGLPRIYIFKKKGDLTFDVRPENVSNLADLEAIWYAKDKAQWPWEFEHPAEFVKKLSDDILGLFDKKEHTHFTHPTRPLATRLSLKGASNPEVFLGRENELRTIRERLDTGGRLMLINAEGGIGKTTLAAKYWNESLYDYQHNAWLFCDNGIINALKELAPKLNLDLSGMNEDQQLDALKRALAAVEHNMLLVLDNANDPDDIRVFKQHFGGFHWHVLLTSRCAGVLDKHQELPIVHLPPPLAKALFTKYYHEDSPDFEALLDRLLLALQYHTLSVEIFAKNMAILASRGETLADLVKRLETEGLFLGKRSFSITTDYTDFTRIEARNSDDILDRFYNFAKLTEDARFWLVQMALLPPEEYKFTFLCSLFGQDAIQFDDLHALAQRGWLTQTAQGFKISPVIQAIALRKNQTTLGTDAQALLDKLNYILEADADNLLNISLTEAAPYVQPVAHLSKCLREHPSWDIGSYNFSAGIYYNNTGDLVEARKCYDNYQTIYQQLLAQDPETLSYKNGLAISYSKLGGIYEATGDWKNALLNYQERNKIGKEIYESSPENLSYKNGLAISYSKLGGIYEQTGDWKNALLNYQEQLRIFKEIYES